MPLDPTVSALLDQLAAANMPALESMTPEGARQAYLALRTTAGEPEPVGEVTERKIPGPGGNIPVRIYTPDGQGPFPVLVYFHGGGWVIGSIDTHDGICRALTNGAECIVLSVEYRLAPEHKFPAAADDAYAATTWVAENAGSLGGDRGRIAVGGDSAGGNLAAVTALMSRERGAPPIAYQLLIYPVIDNDFTTRSYTDNADGYFLTRGGMRWFWGHYLASEADGANPFASPIRAQDLRGLPPGLVITAEYDPLRDEGEAYAERLRAEGVSVSNTRYDGMIHGFLQMAGLLPQAKQAIAQAASALHGAFSS